MKNFVLDSTYKDATIINSNDDISMIPSNNLSCGITNHSGLNFKKTTINYISHHNKDCKFNNFNMIDYL